MDNEAPAEQTASALWGADQRPALNGKDRCDISAHAFGHVEPGCVHVVLPEPGPK